MKNLPQILSTRLALAAAAALAAFTVSSHAQSVTATISDVPAGGGVFDYTVTLVNNGSGNLNSFWYGWTQAGNNLPSDPSNAGNSLGWANGLDGNSIQWKNSTGTPLAPGQSGAFSFVSTDAPLAISTAPSGESVAYVNGIDFSQGVAGDSTAVFNPTLVETPEPSTMGLLVIGLLVLGGSSLAASRKSRSAAPAIAEKSDV